MPIHDDGTARTIAVPVVVNLNGIVAANPDEVGDPAPVVLLAPIQHLNVGGLWFNLKPTRRQG